MTAAFLMAFSLIACPEPPPGLMSMPHEAFDQEGAGWRALDAPGCEIHVADLIAEYRALHADDPVVSDEGGSLVWHEAQLRAAGGQTEPAIQLMMRSRAATGEPADRLYIDATVAFLRRDRDALIAARAELAAVPEPQAFARAARRWSESYPDLPPLVWPLNLDVVDGLIACFDKPYSEAYGCEVETP